MAHQNNYEGIAPFIVTAIAREANRLIGRYGLTQTDVHDIEQDLHLKVWRSLAELDEEQFEASVNRIVRNEAIDMIRKRKRECRDYRRVAFSIEATCYDSNSDEDPEGHADVLDEDLLVCLGYSPSWQSRRWEQMDVEECLASLPDQLRDLADCLDACGGNLSEAARMMGVSRKKARILLARLQDAMS
jgi:RNA polymerase sigma factor (sigma-70 family)